MSGIDKVVAAYEKHRFEGTELIEALKALREEFKAAEDPTLTKVCRLAYEHIEANSDFIVDVFEEEREEGEQTSFEYFLELVKEPNNKFNREEIQEYKLLLLEDLD
ncbi:MAG: hypothetical protein CL840_16625 [Crocinitomicaceae bacterium]|nr:hypothetical protein [Crocinitomicaceae bacterium]|tara:strand:- start:17511 stop:17828 length:318 start_codon:yes stop_codon:yes gene_type:complete